MDGRDAVLQSVTPTLMVPRYGAFEPLAQPGHRFLAAANGEWLEVRRAWLYARLQLSESSMVAKPYGDVTACIEWLCPPIPLKEIQSFAALARASCPFEEAGWLTWNEQDGAFSFRSVGVRHASNTSIHFDRPRLEEGEHLVVDLHSHGSGSAFFSGTDDCDDKGEVKLSMVFGHCDKARLSSAIRLCVLGKFVPMEVSTVNSKGLQFMERTTEDKGRN